LPVWFLPQQKKRFSPPSGKNFPTPIKAMNECEDDKLQKDAVNSLNTDNDLPLFLS